jgi:hypothetical protein
VRARVRVRVCELCVSVCVCAYVVFFAGQHVRICMQMSHSILWSEQCMTTERVLSITMCMFVFACADNRVCTRVCSAACQ